MKTLWWGVVGTALFAFAGVAASCARQAPAPPVDFTDSLTGPASPHLAIPFHAYALTPEGLLRSHADPAGNSGHDRPLVRTRSGDYLSRDFIFEIDVMMPPGTEDIAFVGFGLGEPNPAFYMEPAGAFMFRIHGLSDADGVDVAAALPPRPQRAGGGSPVHARLQKIGTYPSGAKTTFRIEHGDNRVTLSMPGQAGAAHTFELSSFPDLFGRGEAYLFFGNSTEGAVFSSVRVRPRG
ncbi:MAG TPA: hypothetical protein VFZ36_10545 [Vicinamibacterales bacterium]